MASHLVITCHLNQSAEKVNLLARQGTQISETKHAEVVGVSIEGVGGGAGGVAGVQGSSDAGLGGWGLHRGVKDM